MGRFVKCLVGVVILIAPLLAQNSSSITGTVRDSTGAVVPGATVVVTSVEKGTSLTAKTNGEGDYLIAGLPAGHYNLGVTQTGFKQFKTAESIVLEVAQKARVDASLQVGEMATEVSVQGGSITQVQTESPEISGVVTQKEI